ncbi:MAG: PEP-CTERM sorting domain-containing protein [Luteolibacter sp.]
MKTIHSVFTRRVAKNKAIVSFVSAMALLCGAASAQNLLINGDFESDYTGQPAIGENGFSTIVPGWQTTASNGEIEIWGDGFRSVESANGTDDFTDGGDYFGELNATEVSTLFQDVTFTESGLIDYIFLHRGRGYNDPSLITNPDRLDDVMTFSITDLGANGTYDVTDEVLFSLTVTSDNINDSGEYNGFVLYQGVDVAEAVAGSTYRFSYAAIETGSGSNTIGNFIDNAGFGITGVVPEPSSSLMVMFGAIIGLIGYRRR